MDTKLKALRMKTVANGATIAEAESAQRMISRILSHTPNNVVSGYTPNNVVQPDTTYPNGSYAGMPISSVDWDAVAKQYLDYSLYDDYVDQTSRCWEDYNKTRLNLSRRRDVTQHLYRMTCHQVFSSLFEQNTRRKN